MEFRKAKKEDLNQVVEIMEQIQRLHYEARPDIFKKKTKEEIQKEAAQMIKNKESNVIVAVIENEIYGVLICRKKEVINHINLKDSKSLWIDELGVSEKYRKNGIGKELMKEAENLAKQLGCKTITLNCWSFNETALKFYEKRGMKNQRIIMEKEVEED